MSTSPATASLTGHSLECVETPDYRQCGRIRSITKAAIPNITKQLDGGFLGPEMCLLVLSAVVRCHYLHYASQLQDQGTDLSQGMEI